LNKPETTPPTYFHHLRYGTLEQAEAIIAIQKKVAALLELPLATRDDGGKP